MTNDSKSSYKETPPAQRILQQILQRVPGTLLILMIPFTLFTPRYAPDLFAFYYIALNIIFVLSVSRAVVGIWFAWHMAKTNLQLDSRDDIDHWIIIPNYKEDIETLSDTLEVLASHRMAKQRYKICLAMEQGEKDSEKKAAQLIDEFSPYFAFVHFTHHPKNIPGEQRGKAANVAWAAKQIATIMESSELRSKTILTIQDADTLLTADYFDKLSTLATAQKETAHFHFYTPFNTFDRNSNSVPAIVRIMDICLSVTQLSTFLPYYPVSVPLSTYSLPFELANKVGWDSNGLAEDWHTALRLTFATNGALRFHPIYTPASQCNIVGSGTWYSDITAKRIQVKRHYWGGVLEFSFFVSVALLKLVGADTNVPVLEAEFLYPCERSRGQRVWDMGGRWVRLFLQGFHTLESLIWPIHALIINVLAVIVIPGYGPAFMNALPNGWWKVLYGVEGASVPSVVAWIPTWMIYIQMLVIPVTVMVAVGYEGLYTWCSEGRWVAGSVEAGTLNRLGKKSAISNEVKRNWADMLDWILFPIGLVYVIFQLCSSSLSQMLWGRLEYVVAAKPVIGGRPHNQPTSSQENLLEKA